MKVYVYYNLHKKLWSIKALEDDRKGLVIAHRKHVVLTKVTPKVSQKGRERVLREKKKNVHAGLVGEWNDKKLILGLYNADEITYNPYKYNSFVFKEDESKFEYARAAWLGNKRVWVIQ
jgi:hypothetical protein